MKRRELLLSTLGSAHTTIHAQTCFSLNGLELHVIRGSLGLASGASTPLVQCRDIPLTGAKRREGWGEAEGDGETPLLCLAPSPFPRFPPQEVAKGQRGERETQSETDKGGSAERMKASVRVSDSVCNMLCHAGVTTAASPTGVAGCQEKECFPVEWAPEPVHHVDVGQ